MDPSQPRPTPPDFDPVRADWLPVQIYESNEYRAQMGRKTAQSDGWQVLYDPSLHAALLILCKVLLKS